MATKSEPVKRITEVDREEGSITIASAVVVKIGLVHPFQVVGGDVYTFLDSARHRCAMTEETLGIRCVVTSRINGPTAGKPKTFLVPWPNITYVIYGDL